MERTKNERHTNFKWEMNYIRRLKKDRKKNQRRKLQDKRCYKNLREQRIHFWFANKRKKKEKRETGREWKKESQKVKRKKKTDKEDVRQRKRNKAKKFKERERQKIKERDKEKKDS